MLLKALQRKSSKRTLQKALKNRLKKEVDQSKIKTIGVLINSDELHDVSAIVNTIGITENSTVLCYTSSKKQEALAYDVLISEDFGWKAQPKTTALKTFLNTPFDLLISYCEKETLAIQLAATLNPSKLKIGISGCDQRIYDVIIKTRLNEVSVFKHELYKYLTVLNKLS